MESLDHLHASPDLELIRKGFGERFPRTRVPIYDYQPLLLFTGLLKLTIARSELIPPSTYQTIHTQVKDILMASDEEKTRATALERRASLREALDHDVGTLNVKEGYTVEVSDETAQELKLAPDGHTVLIPQPSDDPRDPLNWSKYRKHLFLFIISASAFLPDYGSAVGAVTLLPQAT